MDKREAVRTIKDQLFYLPLEVESVSVETFAETAQDGRGWNTPTGMSEMVIKIRWKR